jgi:hypothetical protein
MNKGMINKGGNFEQGEDLFSIPPCQGSLPTADPLFFFVLTSSMRSKYLQVITTLVIFLSIVQ